MYDCQQFVCPWFLYCFFHSDLMLSNQRQRERNRDYKTPYISISSDLMLMMSFNGSKKGCRRHLLPTMGKALLMLRICRRNNKYALTVMLLLLHFKFMPASVAQLDARPTGDQEVPGSTPAEVGNILSWRLIMKYFLRSFSPFCWFKKGSCQFLMKECAQYWLTA